MDAFDDRIINRRELDRFWLIPVAGIKGDAARFRAQLDSCGWVTRRRDLDRHRMCGGRS